jgi:hypothetical protein
LTLLHSTGRHPSRFLALPIALVAFISSVVSISAVGSPIKLGVAPVGQTGANFVITMQPGESRDLAVTLGNYGTESVVVRTFAADAYSMINGGFAVRLDGEPSSGTTAWLTYPGEDMALAPGTAVKRDFTVAVPADTLPGEYLTSIVLQNAVATASDSNATSGVMMQQILRQVAAVSIDVPGARAPALEVGGVTHRLVADRSMVDIEVHNLGNVRLKPTGEFVLWDSADAQVTSFAIAMDTVFAHTNTLAEIPFSQRLNPGNYTAELTLSDATGVTVSSGKLPLTIPELIVEAAPEPADDVGPLLAPTNQTPVAPAVPLNPWIIAMIAFGAGLGLMLAVFGLGFVIYRRRRHT